MDKGSITIQKVNKMSRKTKSSHKFTKLAEAAPLLRAIADQLEKKQLDTGSNPIPDLEGLNKLEISVKKEGVAYVCQLKAKFPDPKTGLPLESNSSTTVDSGKPKYKQLKKRMERSFKEIKLALTSGSLPTMESVTLFMQDSEQMVTYPGFGDPHYEAYGKACELFRNAFDQKNLNEMVTAYTNLKTLRSICHDQYK